MPGWKTPSRGLHEQVSGRSDLITGGETGFETAAQVHEMQDQGMSVVSLTK
jgi:hypothetical protein